MNLPSSEDSDIITDTDKPIIKTKKSKRKANEAVLGDSRFKIDKQKGIVIY
jgi:hypothetical protein